MTTAARRRYPGYHLGWIYTFLPALALPLWGWASLHEPFRLAGLGVMAVAGLLVIPALMVTAVYFLPAALRGGLVPRDWRKRYRQKHGRDGARSAYITKNLRRVVLFADRYRCAGCHARLSQDYHEIDHFMPWSLGGLTTLFNLRALCPPCNQVKSNFWRFRKSGRYVYVPRPGYSDVTRAEQILDAERHGQWNPLRLLRAALALAS